MSAAGNGADSQPDLYTRVYTSRDLEPCKDCLVARARAEEARARLAELHAEEAGRG